MPWLDPSVAASPVIAPVSSSAVDYVAVVSSAIVEKETVDPVVVKKAANNAVAMKRAAMDKEATYTTVVKKAADEAVANKKVTDVAVVKKATDDTAVAERATTEAATRSAVESSPALVMGMKRVATSGGSTPLAKWPFHGSWKPWYVERSRSCSSFLYVYFVSLGFFIVQCVFFQ
jgi:hypothetical protein